MRNLTIASAKHLLNEGHLTQAHHARITRKLKLPAPVKPRMFGSLAQQAQAPIPGIEGPAAVPTGTATGYGEGE